MRINVTHLSESTRQCIKPKVYWIFWFNSYTYQVRLIIETYHINNQDLEFPCVRGVGGGVLSAAEFMPHIPLALLFITSVQAKQQPHLFCFIIDGSTTPKIIIIECMCFLFDKAGILLSALFTELTPLSIRQWEERGERTHCAPAFQQQWLHWVPAASLVFW